MLASVRLLLLYASVQGVGRNEGLKGNKKGYLQKWCYPSRKSSGTSMSFMIVSEICELTIVSIDEKESKSISNVKGVLTVELDDTVSDVASRGTTRREFIPTSI